MLLIRLHAVYSARRVSRWQMRIILGIPILLNLGRIANLIYFLVYTSTNFAKLNTGGTGADDGSVIVKTHLPSVKIEWFMQIFDDWCVLRKTDRAPHKSLLLYLSYSSALFLYPLYKSGVLSTNCQSLQTVCHPVAHLRYRWCLIDYEKDHRPVLDLCRNLCLPRPSVSGTAHILPRGPGQLLRHSLHRRGQPAFDHHMCRVCDGLGV